MNRRTRTLLRYGLLLFAVFFSLVALAQYAFVRSQLDRTVSGQLRRWANDVQTEIAFDGRWDLAGFRRALVESPPNYLALTKDGMLIDVEGLVPGFLPKVTLPTELPPGRVATLSSPVGERWHLFARSIHGGTVIVGEPVTVNDSDVDKRLPLNAERFGTTLDQAAHVSERNIDGMVDYAVVDERGEVRSAAGGIPVVANTDEVAEKLRQGPQIRLDNRPYYVVSMPIAAKGSEPAGTIVVFKDISLEQRMVQRNKLFSMAVAAVSWAITGIIFGIYEYKQRGLRISCEEAYAREEGQTIEFKSSLRWDYEKGMRNRALEVAVVKTIAAFLNTEGGVLLIGVDDNKSVVGLAADYETLTSKPNRDGFELTLQQLLSKAIGAECYARNVRVGFCEMEGKEICVVSCDRSRRPVIVEEVTPSGREPTLYVRVGNSTKALNLNEALEYSRDRWGI